MLSLSDKVRSLVEKHIRVVRAADLCEAPTVSVALLTYNHVRYIRQALDSVLVQAADFPFEIVISDDCSTDGTREIILEYQAKYPELIALVLADRNLWNAVPGFFGSATSSIAVLDACRGEYIAHCEGDDYWTDQRKLQKQVDVFRHFPDCVICGGRTLTLRDGESIPHEVTPDWPSADIELLSAHDIFYGRAWMKTCSRMIPRALLADLPLEIFVDWGIVMFVLSKSNFGRVVCLDDAVAVYREHAGGVFSSASLSARLMRDADCLVEFVPLFSGVERRFIERRLRQTLMDLSERKDVPIQKRLGYWLKGVRQGVPTLHEMTRVTLMIRDIVSACSRKIRAKLCVSG